MKRTIALTFFSIILSLASIAATDMDSSLPAGTDINKITLLKLVNMARSKGCHCGGTYYSPAAPLVWNDNLEAAALLHSEDMQRNNYFKHADLKGIEAGSRITASGYTWKTYGENIAYGYPTESEVVEGWLKSPSHCSNIMAKDFKEMGIGKSGEYWTQVFGTR